MPSSLPGTNEARLPRICKGLPAPGAPVNEPPAGLVASEPGAAVEGEALWTWASAAPVTGRLEIGHGVELVLWRLNGDVVADAIARIEIETGAGLEAAAERDEQALRDVLLCEAGSRGSGAVYV